MLFGVDLNPEGKAEDMEEQLLDAGREGQMWPFFQKSGCFISKIRSPLCCKRNGNLVIGKSKDCNSSNENNVVSTSAVRRNRFAAS